MSLTKLKGGGVAGGGGLLTGAHQQVSYKPPSALSELPLQVVSLDRRILEPGTTSFTPIFNVTPQAGDDITVIIFECGANATPTYTTQNGFGAITAANSNGGTNGATNTATAITEVYAKKTAVGGDSPPVIALNGTNRGIAVLTVILRPSAPGATVNMYQAAWGTGTNVGVGSTISGGSPTGNTGVVQHTIEIVVAMGNAVNTTPPTGGPLTTTAATLPDSNVPTNTIQGVSAITPSMTLSGAFGNSVVNYNGDLKAAGTSTSFLTVYFGWQETAGGTDPTNELTSITPGNILRSSWVQLFAATSFTAKMLRLWFDVRQQYNYSPNESFFFDIGVGAAGSEVIAFGDLLVQPDRVYNGSVMNYEGHYIDVPVNIPSGSRVAIRGFIRRSSTQKVIGVHATLMD